MTSTTDAAAITGTADTHYNLYWYIESCLNSALRLEQFIADAERVGDLELAELFDRAQADNRNGAAQAQQLLTTRLIH